MAKTRSIHGKRERLEADGETHRRDCECPRCDAGFTPTEHERELAERRAAGKQGRRTAARALERKKELKRIKQLELMAYFAQGNTAADAEVSRLRALRDTSLHDRRMDEFLLLRRSGMALEMALAEVDQRFPPNGPAGADNDNGYDRSKATRAAHQIGLLFP
jgi:hypothetical protein